LGHFTLRENASWESRARDVQTYTLDELQAARCTPLYTLPKRSQITMECRQTGVSARAPYGDTQSKRKQ